MFKKISEFLGRLIAGKGSIPTGVRLALADWFMIKAGEGLYFDDFGLSKVDCSDLILRLRGVCYLSTESNTDGTKTYKFEKDIELIFGPYKKTYGSELVITSLPETTP